MVKVFQTNPKGRIFLGATTYPCAFGRSGIIDQDQKKEGDGFTPRGIFPIRRVFYRPDRQSRPLCAIIPELITQDMGWCDDPKSPHYNQLIRLPFVDSHEKLWRDDHIYDIIVVLGYNDRPVIANAGSAIFFHLCHDDYRTTEGCVAINLTSMIRALWLMEADSQLEIL